MYTAVEMSTSCQLRLQNSFVLVQDSAGEVMQVTAVILINIFHNSGTICHTECLVGSSAVMLTVHVVPEWFRSLINIQVSILVG